MKAPEWFHLFVAGFFRVCYVSLSFWGVLRGTYSNPQFFASRNYKFYA